MDSTWRDMIEVLFSQEEIDLASCSAVIEQDSLASSIFNWNKCSIFVVSLSIKLSKRLVDLCTSNRILLTPSECNPWTCLNVIRTKFFTHHRFMASYVWKTEKTVLTSIYFVWLIDLNLPPFNRSPSNFTSIISRLDSFRTHKSIKVFNFSCVIHYV